MLKSTCRILILLLLCSQASFAGVKQQLHYSAKHGLYYLPIVIENKQQVFYCIADTGSSNLILLGDKKLCPNCQHLLSKQRYTPSAEAKATGTSFRLNYESGQGTAAIYQAQAGLIKKPLFPYQYSVFTDVNHVGNIVGLAYATIAEPLEQPLKPFFDALRDTYELEDEFTFRFRQAKPSTIEFGKANKPLTGAKVPIKNSKYYVVAMTGISDNKDKPIIINKPALGAMLDSATGGFIVLPSNQAKKLKRYIYQHAGKTNQALPKAVWRKNACIKAKDIKLEQLPKLKLNFQADSKVISQTLTPQQYMNQDGCGLGYLRLGFVGVDIPVASSKELEPSVVLGTPFFNGRAITIKRNAPAYAQFGIS